MKVKDIKAAQEAGTLLLECRGNDWMDYIRGDAVRVVDATYTHWYFKNGEWKTSQHSIGLGSTYSSTRTTQGVLVEICDKNGNPTGSVRAVPLSRLRGAFAECRKEQNRMTELKQKYQDEKKQKEQNRADARLKLGQTYGVKFYVSHGQVVIDPEELVALLDKLTAAAK